MLEELKYHFLPLNHAVYEGVDTLCPTTTSQL